ncbi:MULTISPECIES: helix-turn-helix transcriptional regulator [Trichococcus]|uniref:helix-turn-helix transcriptional regulator n=1 Tax=Trichococcus TaxID=82802 RepID=UPI002AA8EEA5|nr:helix-turn-helix transcriptional regulator [Trichococcus shcherbakoviae]
MSKLDVKTKSAGVKFDDIKAQMMEDAEFQEEYNKLQPRYELISQIIEARKSMKMTQEELAKRAGTRKSNISRLESGSYNPSLDFLIKIAKGLGKDVHIEIR